MELIPTFWEGISVGLLGLASAALKRSDDKVSEKLDKIEKAHGDVSSSLAEVKLDAEKHKLYAEQRYIKDTTLVRLYEQVEKGFAEIKHEKEVYHDQIEKGFAEIRQDIKGIIKGKYENH